MAKSRLSRPLPWYRWNPTQWQASKKVARMGFAERGLYRELMDECWIKGRIPSTAEGIADLIGFPVEEVAPLLPRILPCFDLGQDGTMLSPFIEQVRTEMDARRIAAQESAKARYGDRREEEPPPPLPPPPAAPSGAESQRLGAVSQPPDALPQALLIQDAESHRSREEESREERVIPPTPPSGGKARRSRSKEGALDPLEIPDWCVELARNLRDRWHKSDPDGRVIKVELNLLIPRLAEITKRQPLYDAGVLAGAAEDYLKSQRNRYKAPQYFFSTTPDPHNDNLPPFKPWADARIARAKRSAAQPKQNT